MRVLLGTPLWSMNSLQLSALIVLGLPPAGTKASRSTHRWVLRIRGREIDTEVRQNKIFQTNQKEVVKLKKHDVLLMKEKQVITVCTDVLYIISSLLLNPLLIPPFYYFCY